MKAAGEYASCPASLSGKIMSKAITDVTASYWQMTSYLPAGWTHFIGCDSLIITWRPVGMFVGLLRLSTFADAVARTGHHFGFHRFYGKNDHIVTNLCSHSPQALGGIYMVHFLQRAQHLVTGFFPLVTCCPRVPDCESGLSCLSL